MIRRIFLFLPVLFLLCGVLWAQPTAENVVFVTIDGLRWQEVFTGMDSALASNSRFNQGDSTGIFSRYWSPDPAERREKLLPFLWSTVARSGQIYGNRLLGNRVETSNPFWFSYPGYSEILTGHVDTAINTNDYPNNPHVTFLEFVNSQPGFKGKVGAFCAWDAFDRIINEARSGIPVMSAFQACGGSAPTPREMLLNAMLKDSPAPWGTEECLDLFTHYAAAEDFAVRHPRLLYLAYGETDEWAHAGQYASYLNAAHQNDAWLSALWDAVNTDPFYAGKTALVVAVDHGRGMGERWTSHGRQVEGANETWCAFIGPGIPAKGELSGGAVLFQEQLAQTISSLLGLVFKADHPVAGKIDLFSR